MRKVLLLVLLAAMPAYAAMTTAAAKKKAQQLWGPAGCVTTIEQDGKTVVKSVGICPIGCADPYIEFGRGSSDFAAAFAAAASKALPIFGLYKGQLPLHIVMSAETEVGSASLIVDGIERILRPTLTPGKRWDFLTSLDTAALGDGIHTICKKVTDTAGNVGVSGAVLFKVDQAAGVNVEWAPPTATLRFDPPYQPGRYVMPLPGPPLSVFTATFKGLSLEDYTSKNGIEPNGSTDWQIGLTGLKGIPVGIEVHKYTGGDWIWPSNPANWPIYAKLNQGATAGDLYIEPFDVGTPSKFQVIFRYADGTREQADTQ